MPLFKFLRPEIWRWNFRFDGPKRLKYKVHLFLILRCCECMHVMQIWMEDDADDLTGTRNNNMIPTFIEERAPTPLEGMQFHWGKWLCTIISVRNDGLMETKLFSDTSRPDTLGWHFWENKMWFQTVNWLGLTVWNMMKGKLKRSVV